MERFMVSTAAPVQHLSWVAVEHKMGHSVSFSGGRLWDTLVLVAEGALSYRSYRGEGRELRVKSGDCVFFPSGTKNICTYIGEKNKIISVQMQTVGKMPFFCSETFLFKNAMSDPEIAETANALLTCGDDEPQARAFLLTSRFYLLLYYLKRRFLKGESGTENYRDYIRLKPAIDDMHINFNKNRKAAEYAAMVHMCESGFRKLFLKYTGKSPIAYRNHLRMQRANNMIASGEYSVTQAARAVGIENLSFFCREYKKFFGTCANHGDKKSVF